MGRNLKGELGNGKLELLSDIEKIESISNLKVLNKKGEEENVLVK